MRKKVAAFLSAVLIMTSLFSGNVQGAANEEGRQGDDYIVTENLICFTDSINPVVTTDENSKLSITSERSKFTNSSLKWEIGQNGKLFVETPIGFEPWQETNANLKKDSFITYVYNETPVDEEMRFSFMTGDNLNCYFDMNMNFTGWRSVWVSYERDMEGTPSTRMDKLEITAPAELEGHNVYFALMILATPIDARHHSQTKQLPTVNEECYLSANAHWMSLYFFDQANVLDLDSVNITEQDRADFATVKSRFEERISEEVKSVANPTKLIKTYQSYHITNENGKISGISVDYSKAMVIFDEFDIEDQLDTVDIEDYASTMKSVACYYLTAQTEEEKAKAKEMYMNLFLHLVDQGFDEGSGIGTVHHLGYSLRDNFYPALFLMKDVLKEEGYLEKAQEIMAWFSGLGRIFYKNTVANGVNVDVFCTEMNGMLGSIFMLEDETEQIAMLKQFTDWLTYACSDQPGLYGPFKEDGSGFHHAMFYPAYTKTGLIGLTPVIYLLRGTSYRLPEEQHQIVKDAVLMTRLYSNQLDYLVSVAGRHPTGKQKASAEPLMWMALAGSPDGTETIDREVGAAYLRVADPAKNKNIDVIKNAGIEAEEAPNGNWSINSACLALHRRNDWLVGVKGYSKYVPANETYVNANRYGRYISNGQIQILSKGDPIDGTSSGYSHDGWDWGCWTGTTSIHLPIDQIESNVQQVDIGVGMEEMLISDESYSGSVNLQGENGLFAMKLHEHEKYDGSHRARKSVFMFDDRIICLGSNIENTNSEYPTYTTLFQNFLTDIEEPIYVNSTDGITGLGYSNTITTSKGYFLFDNNQNGYILNGNQEIIITRETQQSKAQNTGTDTEGNFTKAVINHNTAPKDETYEYMILVDTTLEKTQMMAENIDNVYNVVQQDQYAHIVRDNATNTTGYALFEAGSILGDWLIQSTDTPVMAMAKDCGESVLMSVCDPDLRLYEGIDPNQVDENGNQKEISLIVAEWKGNRSPEHTSTIIIAGEWSLKENVQGCEVKINSNHTTTLCIASSNAKQVEFELIKNPGKDPEGDVSGGDVPSGDVSGGDVSGGDVPGTEAESIQLDHTTKTMKKDESFTLTATVLPEGVLASLIWASSDTGVAIVRDGVVTAIGSGTAVITVSTADGKVTASCNIVVEKEEPPVEPNPPVSSEIESVTEQLKNSGNVTVNSEGGIVSEDTTYEVNGNIVGGRIITLKAKDGSGIIEVPAENIVIRPISETEEQLQQQLKEKVCEEAARIIVNSGLSALTTKVTATAFDVIVPDIIKNNISETNTVTIIFNVPGFKKGDGVTVLHKPEDKDWEVLSGIVVADNKVAVTLSSFSPIVFLNFSQISNDNSSADNNVSGASAEKQAELVEVPQIYVVVRGDNLSRIAARHGLTLSQLLAMNPQIKNPNRIYPGQQIIVGRVLSEKAPAQNAVENARYYRVQKGDCLYKIAVRNQLSLKELCMMNPEIFRQRYIYAGQKIRVQ